MPDVIIVKEGGGAVYTRGGENEEDIMCKSFFFTKTWEAFEEKSYDASDLKCPDVVENDVAWQKVLELYNTKDRVSIIRKMKASPHISNIMFCKEDELRNFLDDELFTSGARQFNKKASVNNLCSNVRGLFRSIGREHSAEHGKMYKFLHKDLVHSANPMTTAIERFLEDKLEARLKAQGKTSKRQATDKHGAPVSVVGGYVMMMMHMSHAISYMQDWANGKINQKERITNRFNLVLINAFLLHEGSRPIELQKHLRHMDLFLPLHERVYWLTLVFLSPQTLTYLLTQNKLSYYACSLYKGKDKQTHLYRLKSVIPCAFNSLDLMTIYTICMKCIIALDSDALSALVFKPDLNLTSLRARLDKTSLKGGVDKKPMFADATFYSFRYGAAREDKQGGINPMWTRQRMGHTDKSMMKDTYANSKDKRVTYQGETIPLGMDAFDKPTNSKVISLEMNIVGQTGCVFDTQWLEQAFDDDSMREDFLRAHTLVTQFLENDDDDAAALLALFEQHHPCKDVSWLGDIPFGMHISIPSVVTTTALSTLLSDSISVLGDVFAQVDAPRIVPELWSMPQVMYGNWRKILDIPETVSPKDLIIQPAPAPARPAKKARVEAAEEEASDHEDEENEEEEDKEIPALHIEDIQPNDHIVIYCVDTRDPCRLKLPNSDNYVWIAKASGKVNSRGKFTGIFYANTSHDITKSIKPRTGQKETITITDDAVVWIFAADEDAAFELTPENIKEIETRWE